MLMLEMHFGAFAVFLSSAMATFDSFFGDVDSLNTSLLLATQRLAKIAETSGNENTDVGETADEGRVKTTDALLSMFSWQQFHSKSACVAKGMSKV